MHLIIDADPIVYRCGFAAERTDYHLVVESPAGAVTELHFTPKAKVSAGDQMRKWVKAHPQWVILDKVRDVHPDSEETALDDTRTQVQSIEKECREHHNCAAFDQITLVLSGPGNYRERLATVFPYKGNRDPEHKPYHYQSIRNHLTRDWGAIVVHGREADDECSILARQHAEHDSDGRRGAGWEGKDRDSRRWGRRFVVATIDKDLDQIPGWHYNYLKSVHYNQTAENARLFFWQQVLSGDSTDGIPGCFKVGPVKAQQFLARNGDTSDGNVWDGIVREYAISQTREGCPYVDRDPAAVALETARLVYLQKAEGELWNPPGIPMGRIEEYLDDE